jgi:HK97 family phage portal protein
MVTPETAMGLSVVYACVQKISSTIAMLPVHVYAENGSFDRIENNANYLLNKSPNGKITGYELREVLVAMSLLFGKGYARIFRTRNGDAERVELLHPNKVKAVVIDGVDLYEVAKDIYVPSSDVIVIPALLRLSPVSVNSETIGLFKAAQDYAAKFFNGGGVMNGLLTSDEPLSPEQVKELLESWADQEGSQTRMMPFGMKYHRFGVEPDKAQNTDARKYQAEDICRVFNMPPAMIGLGSTSYGDYENQAKAFINNCIAPQVRKIESEFDLKLLPLSQRMVSGFRHDMDELMRGDMAGRSAFYDKMLGRGVYSINDVRAKERMGSVEGGDLRTVQVNQIALTEFEDYSKKIASNGGE